jgi:Rrf2 family protein
MVNLALRYNKGALSISDIAKAEGISTSYLEQLLNRLRREELIKSLRGSRGGYVLSRPPQEITVGDIVRVLEGDTSPVYCVTSRKGASGFCSRSRICVTKGVWKKLARAIDETLDSVNLKDLVSQARTRS